MEDINKKARKAGIWYTIANILLKGIAFLTLPIFTRILSTTDFGKYNTYIAYEGILTAIVGLGLYGTVKNAKIDFKDKFEEYLSSVLFLSLIVLGGVLLIVNCTYSFYASFIGFSKWIINCMILQSFGSYLLFFYGAKLNIEFKYKSYISLSCINTLGNVLVSILLILWVFPNERYIGRIIGSAIPLIFISIVLSFYILYRGKVLVNHKYWKYALSIGIPLVPHVISQSLLSQFDRVMITNMVGSSESGIYSYIYTLCTILYVISISMDNAWNPWIYLNLDSQNEENIKAHSNDYVSFFAILTIGFMCSIPEIVLLFAGNEYWSGMDLILPISIANFFIFLYQLPVGIEYFHKKTKFISIGTVAATVCNLGLNFVFIKLFGYKAAAYTTLISYILLFTFHWMIARKYKTNQLYNIKHILKVILIIMCIACIIYITGITTIYGRIVRYSIISIILVYLFKKRDKYLRILKRKK